MMDGVTPKLFDSDRIMYGIINVDRYNLVDGVPSLDVNDVVAERYLFLCTDLKVMFPNLKTQLKNPNEPDYENRDGTKVFEESF